MIRIINQGSGTVVLPIPRRTLDYPLRVRPRSLFLERFVMAKKAAKQWWKHCDRKVWTDAFLVSPKCLKPDPFNPNEMSDEQMDMLCEDITNHGFDEPIQVVPIEDEDGMYRIVGGEHRYKAAQRLGLEEIPIIIKESWMEDTTRLENMVRRNENRGYRNPTKVRRIVMDLRQKRQLEQLEEARRFGYANVERFKKVIEDRGKMLAQGQQDDEKATNLRKNMDWAVRNVLAQYGDTVPQGFVFFCFGNQFHLMVQMESGLADCVKVLFDQCKYGDVEISGTLEAALRHYFSEKSPSVKYISIND